MERFPRARHGANKPFTGVIKTQNGPGRDCSYPQYADEEIAVSRRREACPRSSIQWQNQRSEHPQAPNLPLHSKKDLEWLSDSLRVT